MTDKYLELLENVNIHLLKASLGIGNKFNINDYTTEQFKKLVEEKNKSGGIRPVADVNMLHAFDRANSIVRISNEIKKGPLDYYKQEVDVATPRSIFHNNLKLNYINFARKV